MGRSLAPVAYEEDPSFWKLQGFQRYCASLSDSGDEDGDSSELEALAESRARARQLSARPAMPARPAFAPAHGANDNLVIKALNPKDQRSESSSSMVSNSNKALNLRVSEGKV